MPFNKNNYDEVSAQGVANVTYVISSNKAEVTANKDVEEYIIVKVRNTLTLDTDLPNNF